MALLAAHRSVGETDMWKPPFLIRPPSFLSRNCYYLSRDLCSCLTSLKLHKQQIGFISVPILIYMYLHPGS